MSAPAPVETLLRELAPLRHSARMARMVELGRLARRDPPTRDVIAQLVAGDFYARMLALQSCFGSRDGELALTLLRDPSKLLRGRARVTAVEVCDDAQIGRALELVTERSQRKLLRLLALNRRQAVIDAWLERRLAAGVLDAGALGYASRAFVTSHFARAAGEGLSRTDIARLASFHPPLMAQRLIDQAAAAPEFDQRLLSEAGYALHSLVIKAPTQALELMRLLLRHAAPAQLSVPLQQLMRRLPNEVAELLLSHEGIAISLQPVASRLTPALRRRLLGERPESLPLAESWFRRIPAAERLSLYGEFERGWRDADGCLPPWLIARLPGDARVREARAHWRHPRLAARPAQRFAYAQGLPWDEARQELEPFIRNPDAELRAPAGAALVETVRFDCSRTAAALQFIQDRKNEQDPVRRALLSALAGLPPRRWPADSLPALGQVIRQALDAADLSFATAAAAERLIVAALPFHSDWAIPWLATLVKERGRVNLGALHLRLNDADVARLAPALLPVLQSWNHRERDYQLIAVAGGLNKRLRVFPGLVEILEDLALNGQASPAGGALNVLAHFVPERFGELVPRLLAKDASVVTVPTVHWHLHRRRQDLLTPYLGRTAYGGRFSTGRTRFVLPFSDGFFRWTPDQVETFAGVLEEVARDKDRDSPALLFAIRQMSALPGPVSPALLKFSRLENKKLVTRDAALRALGRLDAGEGAPLLLETLADDRGRIGIYALRASILEMPADRALSTLRAAPLEKVTVAKEVIRLVGDLGGDNAWELLQEWEGRELHRDVRIALLRALWNFLDRDAAWEILDRAAASPVAAMATMAGRTTAERLSPRAEDRLVRLLAALLGHPDAKVRCDVLQRCATLPVKDAQQQLLEPLMERLNSVTPDEVQAAAGAVFATYAGRQSETVGLAVTRILSSREALEQAVLVLLSMLSWNPKLRPAARAVTDVLATDPLTIVLEVKLAIGTLRGAELAGYFTRRAEALHADALSTAVEALGGRPGGGDTMDFDMTPQLHRPPELEELELRLAAEPNPQLRRLALAALVARAAQPPGWTDEARERLAAYRRDPANLVASAATFLFPPAPPAVEEEVDPDQLDNNE